jgi:hypothetical protein
MEDVLATYHRTYADDEVDEAFGKLFLEAGPMVFMQKFEFVNVMEIIQLLINKAIK